MFKNIRHNCEHFTLLVFDKIQQKFRRRSHLINVTNMKIYEFKKINFDLVMVKINYYFLIINC